MSRIATLAAWTCVAACGVENISIAPTSAETAAPLPTLRAEMAEARALFEPWLAKAARRSGPEGDLYAAYVDTNLGRPWFFSTMITAEAARYWLAVGDLSRARAAGQALLHWQAGAADGERLSGAFPCELAVDADGSLAPRYLYDSGDTLAVVEALLSLFEATDELEYLEAAQRAGVWLRDVMSRGERLGLWVEAYGIPMKAVTASGDFDNRIDVGRLVYWGSTLARLARLSGDESFATLAQRVADFGAEAQAAVGGYFNHYDPGYPPEPFSANRFAGFSGSLVVADDSLRAALGTERVYGERRADFARWLRADQGRLAGYLDLGSGASAVGYWDVISSSILRAWRQPAVDAAENEAVAEAKAIGEFLIATQDGSGGWPWGWNAEHDAPQDQHLSTLTGLWAVADLLPAR